MIKMIDVEVVSEKLDQISFDCVDFMKLNKNNEQLILGEKNIALIYDGGVLVEKEIIKIHEIETTKIYKDKYEKELVGLSIKLNFNNEELEFELGTCNNNICKVSLEKIKEIVSYLRMGNPELRVRENIKAA